MDNDMESQNNDYNNIKCSLTNNSEIMGDDMEVRDMLVQKRPTSKFVKNTMSLEEYVDFILAILVTHEDVFWKNSIIQLNLFSQTLYYIYHLYICQQLLCRKFSVKASQIIIEKALNKILKIQFTSLDSDQQISFQKNLFLYYSFLNEQNIKILDDRNGFWKLSKSFLNDLDLPNIDDVNNLNIVIQFTTFIQFYSADILNKDIDMLAANINAENLKRNSHKTGDSNTVNKSLYSVLIVAVIILILVLIL